MIVIRDGANLFEGIVSTGRSPQYRLKANECYHGVLVCIYMTEVQRSIFLVLLVTE